MVPLSLFPPLIRSHGDGDAEGYDRAHYRSARLKLYDLHLARYETLPQERRASSSNRRENDPQIVFCPLFITRRGSSNDNHYIAAGVHDRRCFAALSISLRALAVVGFHRYAFLRGGMIA